MRHLDEWLGQAKIPEEAIQEPLLGSWTQLNGDRPPTAVFTATHNSACAFARAKQFRVAECLFRILIEEQRTLTTYAEALYLLTCWENRGDKSEICDLLHVSKVLTAKKLVEFIPELTTVVRDDRAC